MQFYTSSSLLNYLFLNSQETDESSEDEHEEAEDEGSISGIHFDEDKDLSTNFKELKVHLKSARLDAIVSSGLGIARK